MYKKESNGSTLAREGASAGTRAYKRYLASVIMTDVTAPLTDIKQEEVINIKKIKEEVEEPGPHDPTQQENTIQEEEAERTSVNAVKDEIGALDRKEGFTYLYKTYELFDQQFTEADDELWFAVLCSKYKDVIFEVIQD